MDESSAVAWLLVGDDKAWSQQYRLVSNDLTRIGRGPANEISVADPRCSRHHCVVLYQDGCWQVEDCGSRNGTFVDGERIEGPYPLEDWSLITLGDCSLVFTTNLSRRRESTNGVGKDTEDAIAIPGRREAMPPIKPPSILDQSAQDTLIQRESADGLAALIGESEPFQQLMGEVRRIAPTEATALIRGESGVGKELIARALHSLSPRAKGPFNCLNCAALSETLLESELFGHEKGAFTGADERKPGKFELSDHGTLFLDEVGELSSAIQAKFLRVLEGHTFHRIGGRTPIQADVRIIAATNRDLESAVNAGEFRRDLYFRLHVLQISVPPLRDRASDIPLLVQHFLNQAAGRLHRQNLGLTPEALQKLMEYDWPGNVRELKNAIDRAVILCSGEELDAPDIVFSSLSDDSARMKAASAPAGNPEDMDSLREAELKHILATLEQTNWNKSRAAEILGIERSTLDRKLKRNKVQRPASPKQ